MKIVHLCRYYWPHIGGVESHVQEINNILVKKGHQIGVITEQFDRTTPRAEEHEGVTIYRFPTQSKTKRNRSFLTKFWFKLNVFKSMFQYLGVLLRSDVIQVHDVFWWLLPFYPILKSKIYITFHGWEGVYPIPAKIKWQRQLYSRWAQGVMHVGAWIKDFYGDEPNTITYGAAPNKIPPLRIKADEYGLHHAPYTFVFIGRLEKENEVPKYLELIQQLTTPTFKPRVLWVGDGKYRNACKKVGKVVGFKPDISEYIHRGKIVLASSYLSIYQAQAYGKLVAAFYSHPLKKAYLKTFPGAKHMLITDSVQKMRRKLEVPLHSSPADLHKKAREIQAFARTQSWDKVASEYEWLWQL